jgi:hypothetical protein
VVNFGFATGADTGPVEMGRGVAAFKAATADADRFDAIMMETSVEAFGNALATGDTAVCEDAHYNLANAIFERAKSAEKQRALAESKAKSKKAKRRHAITLKYVDGLIRQLENCVEHYQETLLLNTVRNDAQTNLDAVREQIRQLREIRIQVRIEESLRKAKKMKCPGEGECEGECEGSGSGKGKRKGSGAGTGERQNEDEGEDDGADEDGAAPDGIEEETGKGGEDKSNRDLHGTPRAAGETEKRDGVETRETEEVDPGTVSRNEIIQRLKRLSQELPVRERSKTASDHRPPNDW